MQLLRAVSARQFVGALKAGGFSAQRESENHRILRRVEDGRRVVVAYHAPGDTLPIGTLRAMIADADWADEDLRRLGLTGLVETRTEACPECRGFEEVRAGCRTCGGRGTVTMYREPATGVPLWRQIMYPRWKPVDWRRVLVLTLYGMLILMAILAVAGIFGWP